MLQFYTYKFKALPGNLGITKDHEERFGEWTIEMRQALPMGVLLTCSVSNLGIYRDKLVGICIILAAV